MHRHSSSFTLIWKPVNLVRCLYPLLFAGCGAIGGQPGIGPDGARNDMGSTYSLAGAWEGLYKTKQIETTGVRETKAKVTLESTGDLVGIFKLELPAYEAANVTGSYRDFAGKSLMIDITSSNFSALGLTGSKTDLPYDLVGDALELSTDRFALKLTRLGKAPESSPPQGSSATSPGLSGDLLGRWTCQDSSRYVWKIHIKTSTHFAADVMDSAGAQASVWMDGAVTLTPGDSLMTGALRVEASDVPKYVGKILTITSKDKDMATLTHADERAGPLTCRRTSVGSRPL